MPKAGYGGTTVSAQPVAVACGAHHTVVLLSNGTVRCFGNNDRAQLGLPGGTADTLRAWPPAALSAVSATTTLAGQAYGNGAYVVAASSGTVGGTGSPCNAFAGAVSAATDPATGAWCSSAAYATSAPYAYAGSAATTTATAKTYVGEWIQVALPTAIAVSCLSLVPYSSAYANCAPGTFHVLGSAAGADGTWTLLATLAGLTSGCAGLGAHVYYPPPTASAYACFRIVVASLAGPGGYAAVGGVTLFSGAVYSSTPVRPLRHNRHVVAVSASAGTTYVEAVLPREMVSYVSSLSGSAPVPVSIKVRSHGFLEWASGDNSVMVGTDHCGAAFKSGALHVWGNNGSFQLGNNTTNTSAGTPQLCSVSAAYYGHAVAAGAFGSTTAYTIDTAGRQYGWGTSTTGSGFVGNNTTAGSVQVPKLISGVFGSLATGGAWVVSVAAHGLAALALDSRGRVHTWGVRAVNNADAAVPVLLSGAYGSLLSPSVSVVAVACGYGYAMAVDTDGRVHAWGGSINAGAYGQLGNNSEAISASGYVPTLISRNYGSLAPASVFVVAVACSGSHTLALDTSGNVHAWGCNNANQLGNGRGGTALSSVPSLVSGQYGSLAVGVRVVAIGCTRGTGGTDASFAIDSDGNLHAWGYNNLSQLGNTAGNLIYPTLIGLNNTTSTKNLVVDGVTSGTLMIEATGRVLSSGNPGGLSSYGRFYPVAEGTLSSVSIGSVFCNFTGQHRCFVQGRSAETMAAIEGLVVCADANRYVTTDNRRGDVAFLTGSDAIKTNDALPVLSLARRARDKTAFGVVSMAPNFQPTAHRDVTDEELARLRERGDQRAEINAVGEGALWVCDAAGPVASGDYVTTSDVPGYAQLQPEPYVCNFTVAKLTMDCDFSPPDEPAMALRRDQFGNNVLDPASGMPLYEALLDPATGEPITRPAYRTRFVDADGTLVGEHEYRAALAAAEAAGVAPLAAAVHRAAFVGCTYKCG